MKIKYECEADENGYTERLIVDGVVKYQSVSEKTKYGTKEVSGDKLEDIAEDNDIVAAFYDEHPTFLGMNLCKIAGDFKNDRHPEADA
jgi:hypothetical protein